jgi:multiple sugar transport system permease protein
MLPAMAVSVPISWMYARLGLMDTHFGLILLYTCFNLSFSTWMMKAFIDEIPTAYEEAALLDGYSRGQVLFRIILPQAATGIMATAVFCLIASWNEYAFAVTLTSSSAVTLPVHIAAVAGEPRPPTGRLAAGAIMFMIPIVTFSILMREHLLRGVTFGAVKG